jgi:hypothetical protein
MIYLSNGMARNPALVKLNLSENNFTSNSIVHLVDVLCQKFKPKTIEDHDVPTKEINN